MHSLCSYSVLGASIGLAWVRSGLPQGPLVLLIQLAFVVLFKLEPLPGFAQDGASESLVGRHNRSATLRECVS